jgi:hypothetical protein
MNECHGHGLFLGERWPDAGESAGEHGLAAAGRAVQQDVMATGSGDLDCPPRKGLTLDLRKVSNIRRPFRHTRVDA